MTRSGTATTALLVMFLLPAAAPSAHAYPLDGRARTGIRRLDGFRKAQESTDRGVLKLPPGALLGTDDIRLHLTDRGKDYDLTMTSTVNGREYSHGNLADIHWSFDEMIAYASRGTRVERGDVIGSGTCGTGCILELSLVHGTDAYPWLQPGDEVVLRIDRLGEQRTVIT